jgi:hypothetical protein
MKTVSLKNLNLFEIDEAPGEPAKYGCDQNWYGTEWQRRAGCGPSTAANMLFYMSGGRAAGSGAPGRITQEDFLALMEDVWPYVTPTDRGIPTTELFYEPFLRYAEDRGIEAVHHRVLNMFAEPEGSFVKNSLAEIVSFVETALAADLPVAFLNLCNGGEDNLDRWHWVTVVSLEYDGIERDGKGDGEEEREGVKAGITVLDNGEIKNADLALWRRTTTLGGGFVYFKGRWGPAGAGVM